MKLGILVALVVALFSCGGKNEAPEAHAIGFLTSVPDAKWHLGSDSAIAVVKDFYKAWALGDYEAMRDMVTDSSKFYFADGRIATSADQILNILAAKSEAGEKTLTFDVAYSVDLDPSSGGEHVQAGFTDRTLDDGVETQRSYRESYYVVGKKIIFANQFVMQIKSE